MKGEIPVFKRCCFCLPLRYGLLAWGYFKIFADVCLMLAIAYILAHIIMIMMIYSTEDNLHQIYPELIIAVVSITLFFTDLIVTIVFIVGGHKKNVRLMRVFYFLSMGMWVATLLLASYTIVTTLQHFFKYNRRYTYLGDILMAACFYFVALVVQTYFLLLLRSEIIKLRSSVEFRFVNNAAEAECTMRCDEVEVETEAVKPDNETNLQASQMTDA
ncbi:hypothetical protein PYW07_012069 [Mythimna separata]|uniref:Uncharacterized protein n=1 Tax=Mythimna separata TaxID=271217 RepID=A0AAD7YKZ3_MYTSE|nr:hypothetical protein PYW07_012069 [Mythimna separata]